MRAGRTNKRVESEMESFMADSFSYFKMERYPTGVCVLIILEGVKDLLLVVSHEFSKGHCQRTDRRVQLVGSTAAVKE